jgi:phosphotransferase family enzyme
VSVPSPAPSPQGEAHLNALLRQLDWRFLLRGARAPRFRDLSGGKQAEALALIGEEASEAGNADLVVLGFPTRRRLERARGALAAGGEIACIWRAPRPGGAKRARRRLRRAGFADVRLYRPGPGPGTPPELWLPLDAPAARERTLAERPPRSRRDALRRRAWQRFGPVHALARLAGEGSGADPDSSELPEPAAWVLLTSGAESDAKVVGFPHHEGEESGAVIAKFARVAKADLALEREAEHLAALERERPQLGGVPRLRAQGRRAGRLAIVQDAVRGRSLNANMNADTFASTAPAVTHWLADLAGGTSPEPASTWAERLVLAPLEELERDCGDRLPAGFTVRARQALGNLGELPLVWEHRDFGPWNLAINAEGGLAAIDWEDAEPRGLPGLDLAYFLTSAALAAEGVSDPGQRLERARQCNARLLDPGTELGGVATTCVSEYCARLGLGNDDFARLRLLCWIVQSLIACRRLTSGSERDHAAAAADAALFLSLATDALQAIEGSR